MSTVSKSFTAVGANTLFLSISPGESIDYSVSGTFVGTVVIDQSGSPDSAWYSTGISMSAAATGNLKNESSGQLWFRFRCTAYTSGTIVTSLADADDVIQTARDKRGGVIGQVTESGQSIAGTLHVSGVQTTAAGVGAKVGSTVSVVERGNGTVHQTILTLTATPIVLTDAAGDGQYGGVKLYDFPAGNILCLGAVIDADLTLTETQWTDAAEGDVGLGTEATAVGTALATTTQNIIATTPIAAMTAQVGPIDAQSAAAGIPLAAAGTTDTDLYLNVRIDDAAAHITGGGFITGTVTLTWVNLGDF